MSTLVFDTNVVSYLMKGGPLAELYRPWLHGNVPTIALMTVAELYEGAFQANWAAKGFRKLNLFLESFAKLEVTLEVSHRWGIVRYQRRRQPISAQDAWIAAAALVYRCPLVTHNPRDFRDIPGLKIITEAMP